MVATVYGTQLFMIICTLLMFRLNYTVVEEMFKFDWLLVWGLNNLDPKLAF